MGCLALQRHCPDYPMMIHDHKSISETECYLFLRTSFAWNCRARWLTDALSL